MIQESVNSDASAKDFGQAEPTLKQGLCIHRFDARGIKYGDAGAGKSSILESQAV